MKRAFLLVIPLVLAVLLALSFAQPAPAGAIYSYEHPLLVVRAYFDDPAMVASLSTWTEPWEVDYEAGYVVVEADRDGVARLLAEGFRVKTDAKLTEELYKPRAPLPGQGGGIPGYPCYRTVEETYGTAEQIVLDYPDLATWIDIGDSWEKVAGPEPGYDLMVLRLTNSAVPGPKPTLFTMTAIHAREYTTAELATRFAEFLVENYGVDPDVTWLLDDHEIHLLLQSNPDGRKKAETGLSWRKNTNGNYCSPTSNSRGADLNRNFEFQWGCCGGSSGSQCDSTYRGPSPASEPETQAVQNYVRTIFPDQREDPLTSGAPITATGVFLDIHSYSELVLWPWGFTHTPTANGVALQTLGRKFAYFNDYYPEQAIGLYPTDGTTDDFAYGELGIAPYTFELGTQFFQGCSTFENSIVPDNMPALLYGAKVARTPYMTPAGPDALSLSLTAAAVAPGQPVTLTALIDDTRFNNQNGTEPTQAISSAEYYVDVPPWDTGTTPQPIPMDPSDGAFDNPVEGAVAALDTGALTAGRHTLYVRGEDAAGNWGPVSAAFLYVVDPAVAPTLRGSVRESLTGVPLAATVSAGSQFQTTTEPATGFYQTQVVSGTYDLTAAAAGHEPLTVPSVPAFDLQTVDQDFFLDPVCTLFSDDVESGVNGWNAQSPWAISTENSHSPTHAWSDSPGGNYSNNRNVSLTSPVLDLTDASGLELNFWHICDTESGYDYCYVELSDDGGSNWTVVASFDGSQTQWEMVTLDASMLDNASSARVRFRLETDFSVTDDGWHVDDISLTGSSAGCQTPVPPLASFDAPDSVPVGAPLAFSNSSTGVSFAWSFGDGATSNETTPIHVYTQTMTAQVTLTATNSYGTDVFSKTIEVVDAPPIAGFTSNSPVLFGQAIHFTNTSLGGNQYQWEFGDGNGSTAANPSHTYAAAGTYTVTLTATNDLGSDTYVDTVTVLPTAGDNWIYLPFIAR